VNVGLGDRAYDVVIGRDLLRSLGARISALRPGAKAVIVTDATVAKYHLDAAKAALGTTIGAFHQPILVLADTALLDTLPEREFRAGYAEVVKYGLLGDRDFFEWLEQNWRDVFKGGEARGNAPAPREYAVLKSVQAKAEIVKRDERETGDRMLLNLGHTFGHAFEAAAGYSDKLLHGEAVGLGMALAFEFSARRGLIAKEEADRAIRHLAAVGLPIRVSDVRGVTFTLDTLMDLIAQDKKVKRGALTFILVRGIGASFVARDVDAGEVRAFLTEKLT
jgi:3-dehydroquinate synthetase